MAGKEVEFKPTGWVMGIFATLIVLAVGALFTAIINHSQDISQTKTDVRVLETIQKNTKEDLKEIKSDVKSILRKIERQYRRNNG